MELTERPLEKNTVYTGLIVNVRQDKALLPNGKVVGREVVEHPGGVAVLPLGDDGTVTMVKQFRYPNGSVLLEIPAGKLEKGEDPHACGLRELREEVGYTSSRYELLTVVEPSPGYSQERLYLYLARGLEYIGQQPDEDEFLEIVKLPLNEVVRLVMDGKITDAKTVIAVLITARKLEEEKKIR